MNKPSVSCVIPVFNGARFIGEALDSVLSQSVPPDEVIVVDDGSTDATPDIVRSRTTVRYVRQDNAGVSAARNHGLSLATGELLAFNDSDDVWQPGKLERQLSRFAERAELEISACFQEQFWMVPEQREADIASDARLATPHVTWIFQAMVIRRTLFDRVGVLNPALRFGEDTEWIMRARDAGATIEVLPEALLRRRIHDANLHRTHRADTQGLMASFLKASLNRRRGKAE